MIKDIKQIINSNFTVVVDELQKLIEAGYKVVMEGEGRPYHMVLGNFIVTVEKMVEKQVEEPAVDAVVSVLPSEQAVVEDAPVVFEPIVKTEDVVAASAPAAKPAGKRK